MLSKVARSPRSARRHRGQDSPAVTARQLPLWGQGVKLHKFDCWLSVAYGHDPASARASLQSQCNGPRRLAAGPTPANAAPRKCLTPTTSCFRAPVASVCRVNVTALLVIGSTLWFDPDLRVVVGPIQDFSSDQQWPKPPHTP